ncbi:MAG: hypothetical protein PHD05_00740 [Sphaerochaetaceae bacterium]|nr:hypothetical protein [Sphaerochaetaceae bacterium]
MTNVFENILDLRQMSSYDPKLRKQDNPKQTNLDDKNKSLKEKRLSDYKSLMYSNNK